MKKITHITVFTFLLAVTLLTACKKDFLNTLPLDQVQASETWKDPALSEAFVNGIYAGLGEGGFTNSSEEMLASFSDEAIFTHAGRNINLVNQGTANPSNPGLVAGPTEWTVVYNNIRRANIALENLPLATFENAALKERLKGEAHFLRAYYYHQLLRFYGGAPLITKVYALGEDYTAARNTYEEISSFILKETDSALLY
jgi:hypothetical protein